MLKSRLWLLVAVAVIGLSACKKNETSVTLNDSEASSVNNAVAASSDKAVATTTQTLSSPDDKLSIVVDGNFVNKMDDAEDWVRQEDLDTLMLLQHDEKTNITLIANDLGPLKIEPKNYFAKLVDDLNKQTSISSLDVGMATENRINYHMSHADNGVVLNESCVVMVANNNLYSVCASSDTAKIDALAAALKTININSH
ncbi:MAG: hypothetical protein J6568_01040 [Snodgrassella sp.]|nr:hypothetical protein [Snodgrassella sp.]